MIELCIYGYIYGLNSYSECSFKSILAKKTPIFFPVGPFFRVSYMKHLSKCPHSKKPPLTRQTPGCASATVTRSKLLKEIALKSDSHLPKKLV